MITQTKQTNQQTDVPEGQLSNPQGFAPPLTVLSWNVNGLGDKIKRGLVLQYIKRRGPAIVLLQEAHLTGSVTKALDRWGYTMATHSEFTSGSRGVGILINKRFPLILIDTKTDDQGRFAGITCQWEGRPYNLVTVYVPPALHQTALPALSAFLLSLPAGDTIIGGDFNTVMNVSLDR